MNVRWAALGFVVALVDCGTKETTTSLDAGFEDATPDDGTRIVDAASDACAALCPATPPTSGACVNGTVCTYGTEPRVDCRVTVACDVDHWVQRTPPKFCDTPPAADCPASIEGLGAACVPGSLCYVERSLCGCSPNGQWFCQTCAPHSNLGAGCTQGESFCGALAQCGGVFCVCGRWTAAIHTCP